jgi:hypothetical protein
MENVGEVGALVLKKSAGIDVRSYPKGQHGAVLDYLKALEAELLKRRSHPISSGPTSGATSPLEVSVAAVSSSASTRGIAVEVPSPSEVSYRGVAAPGSTKTAVATVTLSLAKQGSELETRYRGGDGSERMGRGPLPAQSELEAMLNRSLGMHGRQEKQQVGESLAAALPHEVAGALRGLDEQAVIVLRLTPEVEPIPWEWIRLDGEYLCLRNPLVRAPIGVTDAARGTRSVRPQTRVLLIGDPGNDLPEAREEIESIANAYSRRPGTSCTRLIGENATGSAIFSLLESEEYDVIHFTGRAGYDRQEVYLAFHEGQLVKAGELQSALSRRRPPFLFLNAPLTAFVPPGFREFEQESIAGTPLDRHATVDGSPRGNRGFTTAASAAGVGDFIGCLGIGTDPVSRVVGVKFHEALLEEVPAALALFRARRAAFPMKGGDKEPGDDTALLYILSGRADLALPPARV